MSEKRRATNSTRWSAMSFSMFSMDMAGWPAGRSSALLQGACQGVLGCKRLISFNKQWRPSVVSHQSDAFFLCVAPLWCDNWKRLPPARPDPVGAAMARSEEHTSELQSLMRISYAVFCLKKKNNTTY